MKEYTIIISLKSNLYIGSGFSFARIIDHTSITDEKGLAYIPGSTIKGKLRSVCKKIALTLADKAFLNKEERICQTFEPAKGQKGLCKHDDEAEYCIICRLFGSPFTEGKLFFRDAVLDQQQAEEIRMLYAISHFRVKEQNEIRNNVRLSRYRRVSEDGRLFITENVSKSLEFTGSFYTKVFLSEEEEKLLKYGLKIISHLGGQKARGLGRVRINCPELGLIAER